MTHSYPRTDNYRWEESLVTKNAPFATEYTPSSHLKLIGSQLMSVEVDQRINSGTESRDTTAHRRFSPLSVCHFSNPGVIQQVEVCSPTQNFAAPSISSAPLRPPLRNISDSHDSVLGPSFERQRKRPDTSLPLLEMCGEEKLRNQIQVELSTFDDVVLCLKELYVRLADYDRGLTGNVSFDVLEMTFRQCNVPMSSRTLRELSRAFDVGDEERTAVNYEKLLSFIGSSVQLGQRPSDERGVVKSALMRRDSVKTSKSASDFDFAETWKTFASVERSRSIHSTGFTFDQIKSLSESCRIPLSETAIQKLIELCHNGNGLYRWQQFLELVREFLHRTSDLHVRDDRLPSYEWDTRRRQNRVHCLVTASKW